MIRSFYNKCTIALRVSCSCFMRWLASSQNFGWGLFCTFFHGAIVSSEIRIRFGVFGSVSIIF